MWLFMEPCSSAETWLVDWSISATHNFVNDVAQATYIFLRRFYPNVTTLRSGICRRNSVCRLSVCNVCAPYSAG